MSLFALVSRPAGVGRAARLLARDTIAGAWNHSAFIMTGDLVSFATAVVLTMVSSVSERSTSSTSSR